MSYMEMPFDNLVKFGVQVYSALSSEETIDLPKTKFLVASSDLN